MKNIRISTRTALVSLFVAGTVYSFAYLFLVYREPIHYGNVLMQFRLVVDESGNYVASGSKPSRPPDGYCAVYCLEMEGWVSNLFAPAHWLDRKIRPEYWPHPKPWTGC